MSVLSSNNLGRVLWVPEPPSSGIVSMFRYWNELRIIRESKPYQNSKLIDDLVSPQLENKVATRVNRCIEKYVTYPWLIHRSKGYKIIHGLVHDAGAYLRFAPKSCAKVVTVHDLIPLRYSHGLTKNQIKRFRFHMQLLADMDALIAVSKHTADEMSDLLGINQNMIHIVPNGVNTHFFKKSRPPLKVLESLRGRPYIFSVSSAVERKNLSSLPKVFRSLKKRGVDCALVRAGAKLPKILKNELKNKLKVELVEVGPCSDIALASLYQHAACLLFPSLYEGFGLPILEAMASGCPVVASNTSSIPEVAGIAAQLMDPYDYEGMSKAVINTLNNQLEYVNLGKDRANKFSWESHYNGLMEVYEKFA